MLHRIQEALRRRLLKNKKLYRLFSPALGWEPNLIMRRARRGGVDRNMVVFSSYQGRGYNDNPRYISEALHAMRPATDIVWLFRGIDDIKAKFEVPDYVRCVEAGTEDELKALGRARVWVDNWRKLDYIKVGKDQEYIFSPHYDRVLKTGVLGSQDFFFSRLAEEHATLCVAGSEFGAGLFEPGYRYKGPIMTVGTPRNDILVRNDPGDAARIRAKLGVDADTKLLLYAPTFRGKAKDQSNKQAVALDLEHILDVLEQNTGEKWRCLHRAHYYSPGLNVARSDRMIDATGYPEMAELMRVADAMISDYSSCIGDFLLRLKPVWLYQADFEDYVENSRAMRINLDETPYWRARTPEELDDMIRRTTPESAEENCRALLDYYKTREFGHSAEAVAKYICDKLEP